MEEVGESSGHGFRSTLHCEADLEWAQVSCAIQAVLPRKVAADHATKDFADSDGPLVILGLDLRNEASRVDEGSLRLVKGAVDVSVLSLS